MTKTNLDQIAKYNKAGLNVNNQNIAEVPPFSLLTPTPPWTAISRHLE